VTGFEMPPEGTPLSIPLPPDLEQRVNESVRRFEEALGLMAPVARANGQLERYREEVAAVASIAYAKGYRDCDRRHEARR
jgi:hypothetical protein